MTRVLVCGGRDYRDRVRVFEVLDRLHAERGFVTVIHGMAPGADREAEIWAGVRHVELRRFSAQWGKHGKAAGPIRNQRMIDDGHPDLVVAFPGGSGTADCVARARAAGIEVVEIGG
jgi:hypothetical protein